VLTTALGTAVRTAVGTASMSHVGLRRRLPRTTRRPNR
jgi:hypothetical protein